ncbi:protein of unknown function [Ruminococcaceae bacterium BL-6]|nr:protein of unknown function [Ruminococcaceae bacterium BL-6]
MIRYGIISKHPEVCGIIALLFAIYRKVQGLSPGEHPIEMTVFVTDIIPDSNHTNHDISPSVCHLI